MTKTTLKDVYVDTELFKSFNRYKSKHYITGVAILRKAIDSVNKGIKFPNEPDSIKEHRLKFEIDPDKLRILIKNCEGEFKDLSDLLRKVLRNYLGSE